MDVSSFLTSLGTSFFIFLVLVLLFALLSRMKVNEMVYYPIKIIGGLDSPEGTTMRSNGPFEWIHRAVVCPEKSLVQTAGVDAAVYLLFLRTALGTLFLSAILLLPVLLPIAGTDNSLEDDMKTSSNSNTSTFTFSEIDELAMGNIKEKSPRLWVFLLGTYWVTSITFLFLWRAYKHASKLRSAAKTGPGTKPEDFVVLVRDIPPVLPGQTRKEQVDSYFSSFYPESFFRSMIITDNRKITKVWEEMEAAYRKKKAHAEAELLQSVTPTNPEGTRPTTRTGFLGLTGEKVDTIELCNVKINNELMAKWESEHKLTMKEKEKGAALIFFNNRQSAISASQTLHAQISETWTVIEAPEPRQLLWNNLPINVYERRIRQCVVYGVVFLTVVFYMVPITFISAFTTLQNLRKFLPFLEVLVDQPVVKTVLEAYLPQIALILFMAFLPKFLMFLSKAEGVVSESHAVRAASGKYYYFIVFNVFLGVTVGGTLFRSLKTIEKNPNQIIAMLGGNLPGNATFFLTFVALKFFVGYGLELSRLVPLVIFHFKRKYICKTAEELEEASAPGDLGYETRVPDDMLILTIVLCYSVIAPMIIPFGILYFGIGWLVLRNQALKVYIASYESNGRMWPHMYNRIIAAVIIYQITMIGYFGIKKFNYAPLLIPLPILTAIFAFVCHKRFYLSFIHTPMEIACNFTGPRPNMEAIYGSYLPACLCLDKSSTGSDAFEDALSQASRTPLAEVQSKLNIL